jgi:dTDP-glucose 4,6-dehydratase
MENLNKKVLLTGAGGAIGIHVFGHLMHNTDWEVVGVDSFRADHKGYFDRIGQTLRDHPEWKKRIRIFTHNLCAPFTPREIEKIGTIDYVINLASMSDVQASIEDPIPFVRNNTELMLNILEYVRQTKPEVFLHFSTDEVYGAVPKDSSGHKEWDSIVPSNPYSASKAAQEALAIAWWRSFGVPLIITNTMNNFGEMQAPSKFPAMIQQKIQRGETITVHAAGKEIGTRYYIHSRNTADAVLFILNNVKPVIHQFGEIDLPVRLNIVGDKQVSNLELVEIIGRLMGVKPNVEVISFHKDNPGHDLHYGMNGEKLASLGWSSPMPFEESLKKTIEWQKAHEEWMS